MRFERPANKNALVLCHMTVRRLKTYTGSQGYVYQYYFVGKRAVQLQDATEFIFDVTSDRKTTYAMSIFFPKEAALVWAAAHGRALSDSEQYAAVKMRLFRAFDEIEDIGGADRQLLLRPSEVEEFLSSLGVQ